MVRAPRGDHAAKALRGLCRWKSPPRVSASLEALPRPAPHTPRRPRPGPPKPSPGPRPRPGSFQSPPRVAPQLRLVSAPLRLRGLRPRPRPAQAPPPPHPTPFLPRFSQPAAHLHQSPDAAWRRWVPRSAAPRRHPRDPRLHAHLSGAFSAGSGRGHPGESSASPCAPPASAGCTSPSRPRRLAGPIS